MMIDGDGKPEGKMDDSRGLPLDQNQEKALMLSGVIRIRHSKIR